MWCSCVAMVLFALEVLRRLECFVREQHSSYDGSVRDKAVLVLAYLPMLTWVSVTAINVYDPTLFNSVLSLGILANGLLLWQLQAHLPSLPNDEMKHPAEEASLPWVVVMFLLIDYIKRSKDPLKLLYHIATLAVYAGAIAYAQISMHIFTRREVAMGAFVGAVVGSVVALLFRALLVPLFAHSSSFRGCLSHVGVNDTVIRHDWAVERSAIREQFSKSAELRRQRQKEESIQRGTEAMLRSQKTAARARWLDHVLPPDTT